MLQRLRGAIGRGKMSNLEGNDKNSSGHGNKNCAKGGEGIWKMMLLLPKKQRQGEEDKGEGLG